MPWELIKRLPTVDEYNGLRASVGWRVHPPEVVAASFERSIAGLCAVDGAVVVGMGRAVGDYLYRLIVDVAVHPDYQRRGIGTALVRSLASDLELPYQPIIGLHSAVGAAATYEGAGFTKDDARPFMTWSTA